MRAAFEALCKSATKPEHVYLSLYVNHPFYGGPEEGGWWGNDTVLEQSKHFNNREDAEEARVRVETLAKQETADAKNRYYQQCRRECDWLEERGLEDDGSVLPEVDGSSTYWVTVETERGSQEQRGDRYYS